MLNDFTEERNARNAERQLDFELKQLQKLTSEDSQENQVMIEEKEDQIKNLENILVNKGALVPPCEECNPCNNEKEVCQCFCGLCQEVNKMEIFSNIDTYSILEKRISKGTSPKTTICKRSDNLCQENTWQEGKA